MMNFSDFSISRLPRILFGNGRVTELPQLLAQYGRNALIVTGQQSFINTPRWPQLTDALTAAGITWQRVSISGEPSPERVDEIVGQFHSQQIDVVLAIGGGSVLDAAKAIAGLLPFGNSVMDHLEGVGNNLPYHGPALPFIAVPTTAGTGSEATKNAVLSRHGRDGFKKSFRHDTLIPEYAVIDPQLIASCPPALIAADGMDAFTQLLEAYVSLRANPLIDALAWSGLQAFAEGFFDAWRGAEPAATHGRACMAYASLVSGISLAQVGLGSVHGLASPLGAFYPIPHGVVCGTLVGKATEVNIQALQARAPQHPALAKYARVGRLLTHKGHTPDTVAQQQLVALLAEWTETLQLPRLGTFGIGSDDLDHIVANSRGNSMLTNPLVLTDDEVRQILIARL